jgi:hypothetical protein
MSALTFRADRSQTSRFPRSEIADVRHIGGCARTRRRTKPSFSHVRWHQYLLMLISADGSSVIRTVLGVETIRDGGSLAAKFLDEHGSKWILFLKVDLAQHDSRADRRGFKEPVLIDADPAKRPMDTEDRIYSELSGPAYQLTWEDAQALVAQIAKLPTELTEWATRSFDDLRSAVDSRGDPGLAVQS